MRNSSPYAQRESGGRSVRQPGQIRKEAAVTIFLRVARLLLTKYTQAFKSNRGLGFDKQAASA